MKLAIEVWVCDECHSYYASSSIAGQDLTQIPNEQADLQHDQSFKPRNPPITSHRSKCPHNCVDKTTGKPAQRRKVLAQIDVAPQTVLLPVA